jgi:thiamine-monophosphate kinase
MIDISDGLLADLGHILDLSGSGAQIHLNKLPLSTTFIAHIASIGKEYFLLPLTGGEDYELLFTIPPEREKDTAALFTQIGTRFSVIGEIETEKGLRIIAEDGSPFTVAVTGYNHFT